MAKLIEVRVEGRVIGHAFWCPACETIHSTNINANGRPRYHNGEPHYDSCIYTPTEKGVRPCCLYIEGGRIRYYQAHGERRKSSLPAEWYDIHSTTGGVEMEDVEAKIAEYEAKAMGIGEVTEEAIVVPPVEVAPPIKKRRRRLSGDEVRIIRSLHTPSGDFAQNLVRGDILGYLHRIYRIPRKRIIQIWDNKIYKHVK